MRPIFIVFSALALLGLCACAGLYVAGDPGAGQAERHNFVAR